MSGQSRLGLLDAITHRKGISGGSRNKVWSGHPVVMVYKDDIGETYGQLQLHISLNDNIRAYMGWHINTCWHYPFMLIHMK